MPRRKRRSRRPASSRRLVQRIISPNPATPPTWGEWKARTGRRWWRYPLVVEWVLEWFVYRLRGLALFDLLELAGKLTILVAIIFWFLEADQRARQAEEAIKERHYRAWELINAAAGKAGDGGRRDALQDLNKDGVSLAVAPLENAYLPNIDLKGADLAGAHLQGAQLWHAVLQGANLVDANLQGAGLGAADLRGAHLVVANLRDTNLEDAELWHAVLQGANLQGANLQSAKLVNTNLQDAELWHANLQGAHLQGAKLVNANLQDTNLRGADLQDANLQDANLRGADLWGVSFAHTGLAGAILTLQGANLQGANLQGANLQGALLTQQQLDSAIGNARTQLPDGLTRPAHWSKAKESEDGPPATQPDDAKRAPAAPVAAGSGK